MASVLRYSAVATLLSTAAAAVLGAIPSQTVGGFGEPIYALPLPTEAPSLDLVKKRLEKKDLINTCTEWTIPGGTLLREKYTRLRADLDRLWAAGVWELGNLSLHECRRLLL